MKKTLSIVVVLIMCFALFANPASEQTSKTQAKVSDIFPSEKNITWYVMAPASPTDTIARILKPYLEAELGQTIVVENKKGAGGINMLSPVLNAEPDGYTWGGMAPAQACVTVHQAGCPFSYDSFDTIGNIVSQPQLLFVSAKAPYNTFDEWVDWVKKNPGKFNYYTIGASSQVNIAIQSLAKELDLDINHVPYASDAEGVAAVLGGHVDGGSTGFSNISSALANGDVKIIVYLTETKNERYQEAKSLKELGLKTNVTAFQGVVMTKGVPENRLNKVVDAFKKVMANPEVVAALKAADLYYDGTTLFGDDFNKLLSDSYSSIKKMLEDTGLMKELFSK